MAIDITNRWVPETAVDREDVLRELSAILPSHHFKNSKRYPALLEYLVRKALDGKADELKERTLGIEVFGRLPDYDTNADPVVRITAAEIRKRIAQFYHENGHQYRLQIDLPLGSYVPEFKRISNEQRPKSSTSEPPSFIQDACVDTVPVHDALPAPGAEVWTRVIKTGIRLKFRWAISCVAAVFALIAGFGAFALVRGYPQSASDQFWKPLLKSSGPILAVLPTSLHTPPPGSNQDGVDLTRLAHGAYNRISVCDAVAMSRFASLLGKHSKPFDIKEADLTSLGDLHERSVILLGAVNNQWTMRLIQPLRFHFAMEPSLVRIVDTQNPQARNWTVDYTRPYAYAPQDFAIVARYNDPTTGGNILIIAGIGAHATQAASEFVATSAQMEQIDRIAPAGWEHKNLEMVVMTSIINGEAGPPHLVAAATW